MRTAFYRLKSVLLAGILSCVPMAWCDLGNPAFAQLTPNVEEIEAGSLIPLGDEELSMEDLIAPIRWSNLTTAEHAASCDDRTGFRHGHIRAHADVVAGATGRGSGL